MSAGKWIKEILSTIRSSLYGVLGWLVIGPVSFLIPKRSGRIAVIGRYDGEFADNAKYFFLQCIPLLNAGEEVAFITERKEVKDSLSRLGLQVYCYPSVRSIAYLAGSTIVVVDSNEWTKKFRRFLVCGARIIQLWHGVGFKRIQLNKIHNEVSSKSWLSLPPMVVLRRAIHLISGKRIVYDLIAATSNFYKKEVFEASFLSKNVIVSGYPRNTFGIDLLSNRALWIGADRDLYTKCTEWRKAGKRIVLVMPTFRDSGRHPMELDNATIDYIDAACESHSIELLFKFHPYEKNANNVSGKHLHIIRSDSDVYPIIPLTDALVTDYSSIYTDYSIIDRPILFFVPDLEAYVNNDRDFQFDYNSMTPGPKLRTWNELIPHLVESMACDPYRSDRQKICQLAFDGNDQHVATAKVLEFAANMKWMRTHSKATHNSCSNKA